jgi:hypothetical protein
VRDRDASFALCLHITRNIELSNMKKVLPVGSTSNVSRSGLANFWRLTRAIGLLRLVVLCYASLSQDRYAF